MAQTRKPKGRRDGGQFSPQEAPEAPPVAAAFRIQPAPGVEIADLIADVATDANGWDWNVDPIQGQDGSVKAWRVTYVDDYSFLEDASTDKPQPPLSAIKELCVITRPPPGRDPRRCCDEWLRDLTGFLDEGQIMLLAEKLGEA